MVLCRDVFILLNINEIRHLDVWPWEYLFQCSDKRVAVCILLGASEPVGCPIHIPRVWFQARIIVFCEVSGVGLDVKRGCRTRKFFLSEPLWDIFNNWIAHLKDKGTWLWPPGMRAEEDLLCLVSLQGSVNPPESPVWRVRVAHDVGIHLLWNTRDRDGAAWSPALSKIVFTSAFSKLFCWQPSGASFAPVQKVRDHRAVKAGLGVLVSSWHTVASYVLCW